MWWFMCSEFKLCFCLVLLDIFGVCSSLRCSIRPDQDYNGNVLDCSHTGMSCKDIGTLKSENITTLILSNNNMQILLNYSFHQFKQLKRLECVSCNLGFLEVDALRGLRTLEALDLSENSLKLKYHAFPSGFFSHVPNLKGLNIGGNDNDGHASNYSDYIDIFDALRQLINLRIDSFSNLRIGEEFTKLENLNSLIIVCHNLETINNNSLEGFKRSNVKHLTLLHSHGSQRLFDQQDCDLLFQYLPNISSLIIKGLHFGHIKLMKMMSPLTGNGTKINLIHLDNVGIHNSLRNKIDRIQDRIISADMLTYLKYVCVSRFVWLNNFAVSLDFKALSSQRWRYCLKSFTFVSGGTEVTGDPVFLYQLFRFRLLESFIFMKYLNEQTMEFWTQNTNRKAQAEEEEGYPYINMVHREYITIQKIETFHLQGENKYNLIEDSSRPINIEDHSSTNATHNSFNFKSILDERLRHFHHTSVILNVPPFLTTLVLNGMLSFLSHSTDVSVTNNTLRSVTLRNSLYGGTMRSRLFGFNNLEVFDFTGSSVKGYPTFFNCFPALRKVIMRNTYTNSEFLSQVAENIPNLEYFDIAENGLQWLPSNMFQSNKKLKYLCLASNHFTDIQFDLKLTPNLEILDLRENSLKVTSKDRKSIDDHLRIKKNLSLLLSDNQMSCACSALPFLEWLQGSTIHFDKGGNYTCMTEDGTLSYTAFFSDIASFWRQCQGPRYFLISWILMFTLIAIYLATFLGMKHKTQILSQAMQLVVPGFRLKTSKDFTYDVVIGYADQDGNFVRDVLLGYLEDKWRQRTFVHQRDLLHDPLLMSQAIRDSWRNLLIITENFLTRYDMAHNVMKVCAFFVHPGNPRSVIVMVEERVRHQIPDYVLQVVDEDNIIVIPALRGPLDYETRETLKTRIF